MTNRRTMAAAMIDSRDFIAAKRRAEIEPLLPAGPRITFTGSGISRNLADKARKIGIAVWKFVEGQGGAR